MSKDWDVRSLGEFSEIKYGYTTKANSEAVGPKFLRITDIQDGTVDWETVPYCEISTGDQEKHRLLSGDLVFARTGATTGKSFVIQHPPEAVCASYLIRVRPNQQVVLSSFLNAYFQTNEYWDAVAAGTEGAAQGGFNASKLSALPIPLPPLEEQRRIVTILDEAFEGLARAKENAEANLQNARELFESYLAAAFSVEDAGWDVCELNEHVRFIDYRGKTPPKTESGIRLITAKNVKMGFIQREPEEFILESAYEGWMTRGFPKLGDVLFTTEAPLANVAQLDTEDTVVIGQRLITMQADQEVILPEFLKFSLMSPPMQSEIHRRGTGATVVGIKAKLLKTVPLRFPSNLDRQRTIAANCQTAYDNMERLEEAFKSKLQDIDDLRQSLLQKAFEGELI
ncbi:restriction endonuclease subunit S [Ruegeria arenilitoris]|uniref:restriction endonuclease subunit S n=1 Tax=Ruegeria arenilitoris TaxID=1173585 RepID=UPI0014804B1D